MDTPPNPTPRVVIFDDSLDAHRIFRRLLVESRVVLLPYHNPILDTARMDELLAFQPDLIVVDLLMGETRMDGYHLIRELTSIDGLRPVPIIVWSKLINSSPSGQAVAQDVLSLTGVVAALSKIRTLSADDFLRWVCKS